MEVQIVKFKYRVLLNTKDLEEHVSTLSEKELEYDDEDPIECVCQVILAWCKIMFGEKGVSWDYEYIEPKTQFCFTDIFSFETLEDCNAFVDRWGD